MKDKIKKIISEEEIQKRVKSLGEQISEDFQGHELTVVGVLKGSFIFMADLVRAIHIPLRCDFLRISSYDHQGKSSTIRLDFDLIQPIEGQDVLLVEDILDTGKSLQYLLSHLEAKKPKSLTVCCLMDKKLVPELSQKVRYIGFQVPQAFLLGYGLDLAGLYRELPYIGQMN